MSSASIASRSSSGRWRESTPSTNGIGAHAYESFDFGSTGMKMCCHCRG